MFAGPELSVKQATEATEDPLQATSEINARNGQAVQHWLTLCNRHQPSSHGKFRHQDRSSVEVLAGIYTFLRVV